MNIPVLTGEIPMPDGSVMRLLLNKDWEQLHAALDSIEAANIEAGQAPERDAWLVHRPNENRKWARREDDCPTGAKCVLCKGEVFWWANQHQLWLHCDCTQFIAPLAVPDVETMKKITSSDWKWIAGVALKGIQQWLATS